jgi:hypothetical protein
MWPVKQIGAFAEDPPIVAMRLVRSSENSW